MDLRAGDVFSSDAVSREIKYLYLTGRFRDVRVDGFPDQNGVKLVFTLVPVIIVKDVKLRGNHSVSSSKIMEALQGVEGRELREDRFADYRTSLVTLYQAEGFYGTAADFKVEPGKEANQVALKVYITEPTPTIIADISFSGITLFTRGQLLWAMKSKPGKRLNTDVLFDQDLAALTEKYTGAGYPAAGLGPVNISFRDGKALVLIEGREGPRVTVRFSGNHAFSDSDLQEQVLIWAEHDISDSILDSSADKIKDLYKEDGYHSVKIAVKKTASPETLDVLFDIEEGQRITVKEVVVRGNSHFSEKQIRGELGLRKPWYWLWFGSLPFRQDVVDKGADYLRERYQNEGFLSAEVKSKVGFENSRAVIEFDIEEGQQTLVGAIRFEGNQALSSRELQDRLTLKQDDPYNERLVEEDVYHILSAYSERGYLYARVDAEKIPDEGTIGVTYRVTEDRPVRAGKVIIRGNEQTKESVIRRELLVKPGDPYDYEKILKSQQRIYRFGYFNQARFEPLHPAEKEYVKDMILSVEERPAGAVEVGLGYGDLDRARAFLEVSHRNLWGIAHYGGVRFEQSDILKRGIFNYQHPWFFGYDLQGKFALTWSDLKHINSDTRDIYYETRQEAASYGIEKKLDRLKLSLTYAYENVTNYNVDPSAVLSFQDIGHVRVSSLSPAAVWDLRDDIFNPRRGAVFGVVLKEALHQLKSQADFTKVSAQSSLYIPLHRTVTGALSARAGKAWPHYDTLEVPLHERFYLGGNTTIRGYTQDSVGPVKNDIPTGGSTMWLFNAEIRVMPGERLGFVLFSDAGRVWLDQPDGQPEEPRPPARASFGAGIRYGTPVGPLRIDYGQKIHRRPGESPGELHFNIGHTF